jgi:hypothetical protein
MPTKLYFARFLNENYIRELLTILRIIIIINSIRFIEVCLMRPNVVPSP